MKTIQIRLHLAETVKDFVNIVSKCPFEVDLRSGRHVVDAKSILGIFSLDLSEPLTLEIHCGEADCADLFEDIKRFAV